MPVSTAAVQHGVSAGTDLAVIISTSTAVQCRQTESTVAIVVQGPREAFATAAHVAWTHDVARYTVTCSNADVRHHWSEKSSEKLGTAGCYRRVYG